METTRIAVSEATSVQLDWLMAKCEGLPIRRDPMAFGISSANGGYWVWDETPRGRMSRIGKEYSPTGDPALMWPLIESKGIGTTPWYRDGHLIEWTAKRRGLDFMQRGPSSLIAAARCHIVSELGPVVDVPIDLVETAPPDSQDHGGVDDHPAAPAPGQ